MRNASEKVNRGRVGTYLCVRTKPVGDLSCAAREEVAADEGKVREELADFGVDEGVGENCAEVLDG